jgi:2'-5' RNA ligase
MSQTAVKHHTPINFFVGITLDDALRRAIVFEVESMRNELGLSAVWRPESQFHITLRALGWNLDDEEIALHDAALRKVRFPAFEITFDRMESWSGPSPFLVLRASAGSDSLKALYLQICSALGISGNPFVPHLTLGYDATVLPSAVVIAPITITVDEIVLFESFHGQTRHNYRHRYPLNP